MVQDTALRYWVTCSRRFERKHFKDPSNSVPLKMKALRSFETSVTDYPMTRGHSSEEMGPQPRRHENLKHTHQQKLTYQDGL